MGHGFAERRRLLRIALLILIGYFCFVFEGLSSHLNPWSQALINAMVKFGYDRDKLAQDEITVLLFREDNLASLNTHYPVPYAVHADVLEALATYAPKAVFIDFAFVDSRKNEKIEPLAQALCDLRDAGSRVYVAAPLLDDAGGDRLAIPPALAACATPVTPEMDEKAGGSGILTYASGQAAAGGFVPSPAFALAGERAGVAPDKAPKLEIVWGNGVAPLNRRWMDCREKGGLDAVLEFVTHGPLAGKSACPYHRTISVNHLLNSAGDADIDAALQGRTVFYGAGFKFTGDRIDSPIYAEMPGVYLHAMAYDNLANFGPAYKQAGRDDFLVKLLDFALLVVASVLVVCLPAKSGSEAESIHNFVENFGKLVIGALAAAALLFAALHFGGRDGAYLAGVGMYLAYRVLGKHDRAFGALAALTLVTSLLGYYFLALGPRNILAFLAFFEIVRKIEETMIKKSQTYSKFKELRSQRPAAKRPGVLSKIAAWVAWGFLLDRIFWPFAAESHAPSMETKD